MRIAASFLSIKEDMKNNIKRLDINSDIDYLHVDVMDNIFVPNQTLPFDVIYNVLEGTTKPKDVHLMVSDIYKYVDLYAKLNPEIITFHYEACDNIMEMIRYIKEKGIKVGISIKPSTKIEEILTYLPFVDMILVMTVEPGYGGQEFIMSMTQKANELVSYRIKNELNYLIEVDGGINDMTIKLVRNVDIAVVGSFITSNNYEESINKLKS